MTLPEAAGQKAPEFSAADTARTALVRLSGAFAAAGLETPELDARFLLRGVLGITSERLIAEPDRPLGDKAAALALAALRRIDHEPVARILGCRTFYGRDFEVTPDVLDPRPETETIVDAVLEIVRREGNVQKRLRIADIGTGSGAILITLLAELASAEGVATDISPAALAVASRNARRHGVESRFAPIETRCLENVAGPFDIIVSNPPYIPAADIAGLAPEVRDFDPVLALDGGPDGLAVYREIANSIKGLAGAFWVVLEVGAGQAEDVEKIFRDQCGAARVSDVAFHNDLGGHVRCVTVRLLS